MLYVNFGMDGDKIQKYIKITVFQKINNGGKSIMLDLYDNNKYYIKIL